MNNLVPVTVTDILQKFDASNIEYAVLRNYEQLPNIGHDLDLVCTESQIEKIREILAVAAKKHGWEFLVEYPHYRSGLYMYNICVFKFYDQKFGNFLQIDLFGGFSIWAASGISAEDFIARRLKHDFFYKIDFYDELIIRAMQLGCAVRDNNIPRVEKLRDILLGGDIERLESVFMTRTYGAVAPKFLGYLHNEKKYREVWQKYKVKYLLAFAAKRPFYAAFCFCMRVWYLAKLNFLHNPGVVLFVNRQKYNSSSVAILDCLSGLKEDNMIIDYYIVDRFNFSSIKRIIQVKKMGGVIVWPTGMVKKSIEISREYCLKKLMAHGSLLS
ncbi:MAG: hypothetical protein KAS93_03745 [Gammaproteobacteria bacterium]|nr:hypothetical protein [Gammaproteobacteria bacterium]